MNYTLSVDERFLITQFKEMYQSNNAILNSIIQYSNYNLNNNNISRLISNLINSNNDIMRNITNLNANLNVTNRQQNNIRQHNNNSYNNRQQNNINYNNRQQNNNRNNNTFVNPNVRHTNSLSNIIYSFLEPIEIFPTLSQIESATRVVRFGDIITPLNTACPITLENFNENDQVLVIRHCNHIFNNTGLISWFTSNCRCPVCRYDIRNYVPNHANNISELSANIDLSANISPSSINSIERNSLVDLLFNDLLGPRNINDNTTNAYNNVSDASGNLLRLFFTH